MAKMSPVVHFEMGYKDKDRMVEFYKAVFGWKTQQMGQEMGGYVVAETGETDQKTGRPKDPGTINGGFYAKSDNPDSHAPSVVIAVDDIKAAVEEVKKAGGKIKGSMNQKGEHTLEPQMIPGVGLWVSIEDTEGNRVSMLQPQGM